MDSTPGERLWKLLPVLWLAGAIAAYFYSGAKSIPAAVALPVAVAFLLEISFYVTLGTGLLQRPELLAASGVVSYLVYSIPTGVFSSASLAVIALSAAVAAFWLRFLPPWTDALYLAFMAAMYLFKVVREPYVEPLPGLRIGISALGQLMWFRIGIASLLARRNCERMAFGFLPRSVEWRSGLRHFLLLLPAAALVIWAIGFAQIRVAPGFWWKAPLTFAGMLWVVALAEETFFRGILLERLRQRFATPVAVAASSVAFGLVHLWFGDAFPNWKHAVVATVLGIFCARAYLEAPGIRAAMVTHALAATAWKMFLR
jgi:membrane protease YdiL (CAAX protease family)